MKLNTKKTGLCHDYDLFNLPRNQAMILKRAGLIPWFKVCWDPISVTGIISICVAHCNMKALKAPMRSIPGLKASNICKAWRNAARNVKMPQVLWLKFQQKVDQQISATPVQIQTKNFQRTYVFVYRILCLFSKWTKSTACHSG